VISLARETIQDVKADVESLAPLHHHEAGCLGDEDFCLDWEVLHKLEDAGVVRIFTAREGDRLAGYCCLMVSPTHTQYKGRCWATQDSLYVLPDYRGLMSLRFLIYQDLSLASEGIQTVYRRSTLEKPYDRLLLHIGYQMNDRGYVRDLRWVA